ncbi:hypothetical protein PpBr36_00902 [Pyricularia pennisetigena]|uniref:hypothetical protein n=1 Tax=Pyricularia pennisetigena TaxID=1578925 RepID=UPI0011504F64|nr:hypothetical protein PpBr36_00902 [Pyricularia pennisetigena]TLS29214.1 hypothetical protein PpBr36_00902 [Pyricularia pennisetigena]
MRFGISSWAMPTVALAAVGGAVAQATSGSLNILTMNVAGLPTIINGNDVPGDKATNSRNIGDKLSQYGYDLAHLQEDFNFHAYIYETNKHPFRTATSGGVPFGSGLNSVSNYDWIDFDRVKWDVCSNASGADCLTPKGFTFMRLRVAEGVYVDCYNLHADAGSLDDDMKARNANLRQVSDAIKARSEGNAVLVFGDTNSRYTRIPDGITVFRLQNGMTDPWVELIRGGVEPTVESLCSNPSTTNSCETVDKVFYRSSPTLTLKAKEWSYASNKFLQDNGDLLSDHNPIAVNFDWSVGSSLRTSDEFGGPHGTFFSDVPTLAAKGRVPKVSAIQLRGANRLDWVSVTLADGSSTAHGGSGGTASDLALAANEFWTGATLCRGQRNGRTRNFYIKATTSTGRTVESGKTTEDCKNFTAPAGWQIVGFAGREGDEVDRLAFVYAPQ